MAKPYPVPSASVPAPDKPSVFRNLRRDILITVLGPASVGCSAARGGEDLGRLCGGKAWRSWGAQRKKGGVSSVWPRRPALSRLPQPISPNRPCHFRLPSRIDRRTDQTAEWRHASDH